MVTAMPAMFKSTLKTNALKAHVTHTSLRFHCWKIMYWMRFSRRVHAKKRSQKTVWNVKSTLSVVVSPKRLILMEKNKNISAPKWTLKHRLFTGGIITKSFPGKFWLHRSAVKIRSFWDHDKFPLILSTSELSSQRQAINSHWGKVFFFIFV